MIDLLAKQNEHLLSIVNLMKTDRLMQYDSSKTLDEISKYVKIIIEQEKENKKEHKKEIDIKEEYDTEREDKHLDELRDIKNSIEKGNRYRNTADKAHLESLKKLQDVMSSKLDKNEEYKGISDNVKGTKVTKTFKESLGDIKSNFMSTYGEAGTGPDKVTGKSFMSGVKRGLLDLNPFKERARDEYDYIREEKNRGNEKSDTDLKGDFEKRRKLLLSNEKNEGRLKKLRGGQSESDFLKKNSKSAQEYTQTKIDIGKSLKEVDSRFQTDDEKTTVNELDDYKKNERNLGNRKKDKTLESDFLKRTELTNRNEENQKFLEKERGSLTEEEYLAGKSKGSKKYLEEKTNIGKGLEKVDSRYTLGDRSDKEDKPKDKEDKPKDKEDKPKDKEDKPKDKEDKPKDKEDKPKDKEDTAGLGSTLTNLTEVLKTLSDSIPVLIESNKKILTAVEDIGAKLPTTKYATGGIASSPQIAIFGESSGNEAFVPLPDGKTIPVSINSSEISKGSSSNEDEISKGSSSNEDEIEANRSTKLYQDTQLDHSKLQNETLTEQLDTQKEILDILKESGTGVAPVSGGSGIGLPETGGVLKKAGGFLKKAGGIASRALGVLAAPLAVGVIGAGIARAGAEVYSDSFGEGGFDVVKKLHDEKIIDYNATIAGFNPSEVLDWEKLQKVPPEDIKKLLDSGVEFSPEDTDKIKKIYEQSVITGGKDAGTAKPATPEGTAKPATPEGTAKPATPEGTAKPATPEGTAKPATPEGTKPEQVTPESQGYQEYTPRPSIEQQLNNLDAQQVTPEQPTKANPLTVVPRTADSIYNQSAETTSSSTPAAAPVINNISAPNNTVNNSSSKSPMKIDVKNPESSVNNMFASRQRFS
jgi:hypothetical protein